MEYRINNGPNNLLFCHLKAGDVFVFLAKPDALLIKSSRPNYALDLTTGGEVYQEDCRIIDRVRIVKGAFVEGG